VGVINQACDVAGLMRAMAAAGRSVGNSFFRQAIRPAPLAQANFHNDFGIGRLKNRVTTY